MCICLCFVLLPFMEPLAMAVSIGFAGFHLLDYWSNVEPLEE